MSCLGLLLLRLANQNKGDHSHKKNPLPFFHHKVQRTQLLNSKDQYSAGSFAVRPFPLTHHLCKSHKVFQQKETLCSKCYTVRKMVFFASVISSLEKTSSQCQDSAKTGRDLPGLALTCPSVCGCLG